MEGKRPSESAVSIAEVVEPQEANFLGKLFGGALLAKIDLCAYATSAKHSGAICVTASFDRVDFHSPIEVGELVTLSGTVTFVGRTSMEIMVEVFSENLTQNVRRHTNTARVTMVALKDGKPTAVPPLICDSRQEKILFVEAKLRRKLRAELTEAREKAFENIEGLSDLDLDLLYARESG